ncbi:hypothetical protein LEP1GSC008_3312 [Leptospira kirschneri serovar Bulgarica str. Nikolaevo]|uniref:Uncharacterized protein n=1 Tax=Leptospira kirschneri serovar Bulgarica str. Nikolaevo TaxID=1240687 RepID=M6F6A5_9LEPT|nr:hypothetical protein LEP1GSC008_3312 [Leptospira kirschneri serovar Bulgarica str. Nikolaevo]
MKLVEYRSEVHTITEYLNFILEKDLAIKTRNAQFHRDQ